MQQQAKRRARNLLLAVPSLLEQACGDGRGRWRGTDRTWCEELEGEWEEMK